MAFQFPFLKKPEQTQSTEKENTQRELQTFSSGLVNIQDIIAPEILYLSFLEAYENGEIDMYSVQSTGISNFKWSEYIERVTRSIPPLDLQQDFQDKVVPIFTQINILGIRNANLRKTRDLLLPKLMSGDIRV